MINLQLAASVTCEHMCHNSMQLSYLCLCNGFSTCVANHRLIQAFVTWHAASALEPYRPDAWSPARAMYCSSCGTPVRLSLDQQTVCSRKARSFTTFKRIKGSLTDLQYQSNLRYKSRVSITTCSFKTIGIMNSSGCLCSDDIPSLLNNPS